MSLDQLRGFLKEMQNDDSLKNEVISSSTADDVALIAMRRGYEFSGDELLRFSGKKVGKVTVQKNDVPGEYN
ncbi:Nif11-like leader peptide family natural product precursor [Prochlorococcus marinus]|uniref:Nif11-like leader peptide family natural product n=1 Tax=Prochlorococcus marinus XMU1408 TaxID=2213228 RepID=A0A318RHP9_PROMR|nr:Nif11-like leader peptide family natural product precursor [Prochlorococcus marinus]MBW3042032.1 Nif11-like leader peptide family natural product precursor [Prochlorococcus marinus str. XMU1408]PYE03153.1 Nif11-like leader peptide family natural product precursor [Prochlorococcus marinus XMU1408]